MAVCEYTHQLKEGSMPAIDDQLVEAAWQPWPQGLRVFSAPPAPVRELKSAMGE